MTNQEMDNTILSVIQEAMHGILTMARRVERGNLKEMAGLMEKTAIKEVREMRDVQELIYALEDMESKKSTAEGRLSSIAKSLQEKVNWQLYTVQVMDDEAEGVRLVQDTLILIQEMSRTIMDMLDEIGGPHEKPDKFVQDAAQKVKMIMKKFDSSYI